MNYLNPPWQGLFVDVGVADPACAPNFCEGFVALITTLSATVTPVIVDGDGDGVPDAIDKCPGTTAGGPTNADGCSITQLVPCAGPLDGGSWRNHGQYVSSLSKTADQFVQAGVITAEQEDAIVGAAAQSTCGK